MKTQLIVLEPHDDLISVRDRMSWAKTPRILLIWPVGRRISLRPIDLKILDRHAQSLGARLGLMTRDRAVQREAAALGLPVFHSTSAAQRDRWQVRTTRTFRPARNVDLRALQASVYPAEARWRNFPVTRILFFALGVLAVLTIVALFIPRAEIALSPETKTQQLTIPVVADPTLEIVFITGNIPASEVTRTVSGSQSLPATGVTSVPEAEAKGIARFENLTSEVVLIPAGTIIQTLDSPPVRFATVQDTQVPAGVGEIVDVPMQALNAGLRGNLDEGLVKAIEGPLGLKLGVTNPAPTTGATERKVRAPSASDRERLRTALLGTLREKMLDEMLSGLPAGSVAFPGSVQEVEVLEETYDPSAGDPGDKLTLTLNVTFTARYASGDDLIELASLALGASVEDGFAAVPNSLSLDPVSLPITAQDGRTSFRLRVERRIARTVDAARVLALIQGRDLETAQAQLKQLPGLVAAPEITLRPGWWPFMPLAPFQIDLVMR